MTFIRRIVDVANDEVIDEPITGDEAKALQIAANNAAKLANQIAAQEADLAEAKIAAEAKLAALGLTPEDLAALLS